MRDLVFAVGEDFLHFAKALFRLRRERTLRVLQQHCLEFVLGHLCLRTVAVGLFHHLVMRHADLHLRVGGFFEEREEGDEVLIFCYRLREVRRAAFFVVGIGDGQFGFGEIFAIGVGVD